jgi:hypothetical protein
MREATKTVVPIAVFMLLALITVLVWQRDKGYKKEIFENHIASCANDIARGLEFSVDNYTAVSEAFKDRWLDCTDRYQWRFEAVDGANRMRGLINDLLAYSRLGTRGKDFERTDCEAVFERAIANLKTAIEESGAVMTHDALPAVMADDAQLGRLFQNLIENAIKFRNEAPPRIHVSAKLISDFGFRNQIPKGTLRTAHCAWRFENITALRLAA